MELHAKTQVRLVAAIFANGILVKHVRKWRDGFDSCYRAGAHHHGFDHIKNIFLAWKGHFHVQLRELGLAVGAQILIAKTLHDLKVAVQAADHQDLLKNLRRLRQGVKLAVMHAAGNQIIASAFRRGARQHGRFDFEKAQLVHGPANFQKYFVAQRQIAIWPRPAQIEVAVAQPRLLSGIDVVFDLKRRRLRSI